MNNSLVFVRPVSRRGQVVLPKDIRAHLGVKNEVVFEVHDDHVEIRPSAAGFLDQFLSLPRQPAGPHPKQLKKLIEDRHADLH